MSTLIQTNFFRTTKYPITEEGLEISFRSFTRKYKETIPFEDIGASISLENTYNKAAFYPMIFLMCISLIRLLVRILWLNSISVFTNQEVEEKKKVLNMLFACDGGKYDISLN